MAYLLVKSSVFTTVLMALVFSLSLFSLASAISGIAGFFNPPYYPTYCNGRYNRGVMVAIVVDDIWKDGAACGKDIKVSCINNVATRGVHNACKGNRSSVIVKIVDLCEDCKGKRKLDLSLEAFAKIADKDVDVIKVSFFEFNKS